MSKSGANIMKKWSSTEALLKEYLAKSLVIEFISMLLVEDNINIEILSSMNNKTSPEKYF